MFLLVSVWLIAVMVISKLGERALSPAFDWLPVVYEVSFYALLAWCTLVFAVRVSFALQLYSWRKALLSVDEVITRLQTFPAWKKAILGFPAIRSYGAGGSATIIHYVGSGDGGVSGGSAGGE